MKRHRIIAARQALLDQLPVTGELLRGSLIERILRHRRGLRLAPAATAIGWRCSPSAIRAGARGRSVYTARGCPRCEAGWPTISSSRKASRRSASSITICCARTTPRRGQKGQKRDRASPPATQLWRRADRRRGRRPRRSVDAVRRSGAGGRSSGGDGVWRPGAAASEERDARSARRACRSIIG